MFLLSHLVSVVLPQESCFDYDIKKVSFLALFFTTLYLYFLWTQQNKIIKSWKFPGPINLPIIGNMYIFLFCRKRDILPKVISLQKAYPMGLKIWFGFGFYLVYLLNEPKQIERILSSPKYVTKEDPYYIFRKYMGNGLFTAPVEKWKKNRKLIFPSFNQQILNTFVEIFNKKSLILNEVLSKKCDGREIEIEKLICRCILDNVLESIMGVYGLDIQKTNTHYADTVDRIFVLLYEYTFSTYIFWDAFAFDKKTATLYLKKLNELGDKIIQMKVEHETKKEISVFTEEEKPKRLPFLDNIIKSGEFSPLELRDEVITFLLGATDTATSGLTSLFVVLGMFPEIQQKVYEEMIQVLDNDRAPEYSDLSVMVYTEQVIKEAFRLFPPAPYFTRTLEMDVDVGDNNIIPKGAIVAFGLIFIHRNPKYWPDPLKFDPDRFLPEEVAKRHPCTFMPFSYGPRNCVGMKYGMMNIKVVLATVIRKFKIHCGHKKIEDIMFNADLILRFLNGAKVSMTPRM